MRLFCCIIILQGSQGISAPYTLTLPARSSVLYLCDWKIRKKSEPISNLENLVRIILVWCGRWDWILTARRRSVSAALRPHCGLIHYGFFKSHALRFFVSKTKKPSVLSKAFAGAVDETKSEPEAPASVTCPSMNFTCWSSKNSRYTCQPHIMGKYNKLEVIGSQSYITESARGFANSLELHFTLIALKFFSAVFLII